MSAWQRLSRPACNRGHSVAELLVYCTLFLMLLSAVFGIYLMGRACFAQAQDRVALQGALEATVGRLSAELRETSLASVTVFPSGVIFQSARFPMADALVAGRFDRDATSGLPVWHKYIAWYVAPDVDGRPALYRAEWSDNVAGSQTASASPWSTSDAAAASSVARRVMARDVNHLGATLSEARRIVAVTLNASRGRDALSVATEVRLRN